MNNWVDKNHLQFRIWKLEKEIIDAKKDLLRQYSFIDLLGIDAEMTFFSATINSNSINFEIQEIQDMQKKLKYLKKQYKKYK